MAAEMGLTEIIKSALNITESYEMPGALLKCMLDKETREQLFDECAELKKDLDYDWFTEYFQEFHGDRKTLKQDFTPKCICNIVAKMIPIGAEKIFDMCAGTGGLTIAATKKFPDAFYSLVEIAQSTVPMLLFNMSIRNINGQVIRGNVLTGEYQEVYKLEKTERYSDIKLIEAPERMKYDAVISNPPYSIRWENAAEFEEEEPFRTFGLPQKGKADYGFVLRAIENLADDGKAIFILPHGVLFRGKNEGAIRKNIIEKNLLRSVIGLPDKLFLNTGIPVCVIEVAKGEEGEETLFIDASKTFVAGGKQNNMTEEHIEKVLSAAKNRWNIEKFSHLASKEEITRNEYNLNIPRYVDTYEPPPEVDIVKIARDLASINKEIRECEIELLSMMKELVANDEAAKKEHEEFVGAMEDIISNNTEKEAMIEEQLAMII